MGWVMLYIDLWFSDESSYCFLQWPQQLMFPAVMCDGAFFSTTSLAFVISGLGVLDSHSEGIPYCGPYFH